MRPRGSRLDNLQREIKPLLEQGFSESNIHHAMAAVSSAIAAQRIDYSRAAVLDRLGKLMLQTDQLCTDEQFRAASGPRWDRIRNIIDQLTPDQSAASPACAPTSSDSDDAHSLEPTVRAPTKPPTTS
jgi:hypothetical protein